MLKPGTPEYHSFHSRKWFIELSREKKDLRNRDRTKKRQDKKTNWVKKFGSVCHDCKNTYIDCVFDFHHLDIQLENYIKPAQLFMMSEKRIEEELSKCIMLCSNCHRTRHNNDNYLFHSKRTHYAKK